MVCTLAQVPSLLGEGVGGKVGLAGSGHQVYSTQG